MFEDTIIAISTPPGHGGLGVVRFSGSDAAGIAARIFKPKTRRKSLPPRRPVLGRLYNPERGEAFEEGLQTYFPGPRSYTTEDVVEISCHGSPAVLEEILRLGIGAGARLAEPGEFTLRAFLGGRLDLIQAQAVDDIIRAPSLRQAKISFSQLEGGLSRRLRKLRDRLLHVLAQVEAGIEFPDEDLRVSPKRLRTGLQRTHQQIDALIRSYDIGRRISEGVTLTIAGSRNVGKSTLFNALLERERAIVTPMPGTTRDYLRETLRIGDTNLSLVDTAGLSPSTDPIEKEGVRRSLKLAKASDGVLLVLDASRPVSRDDLALVRRHAAKPALLVFNKSDLPARIDRDRVLKAGGDLPHVAVSALRGENLDELKAMISSGFAANEEKTGEIILHLHQKLQLEGVRKAIEGALSAMDRGEPEDIIAEELRGTIEPAGRLLGEIRPDDVLNDIFRRFCVGK